MGMPDCRTTMTGVFRPLLLVIVLTVLSGCGQIALDFRPFSGSVPYLLPSP
jgi:hypothetical protein